MTRNRVKSLAILAALVLPSIRALGAQTVTVSGNPGLLRISTAVAGSQPTSVSNVATTYSVTTPNPNRTYQILASLNANMPSGVTLTGNFAPVSTATSNGPIALDVTPRAVVINIPKRLTAVTAGITYTLAATAAAGVVANQSRTVTLTITTYP